MYTGAGAGEEAGVGAPALAGINGLNPDGDSFAVIHDEPFISIVYDGGQFNGVVINASPEKLQRASDIAASYNLIIFDVQPNEYGRYALRLREVCDPDPDSDRVPHYGGDCRTGRAL